MNTLPPEPSANDPVSATFIKALMRYIRANTILNGPGYRTNRGPNGTSLVIDAAKTGSANPQQDRGCFRIEKIEKKDEEEGSEKPRKATVTFGNPYYMVGGRLYTIAATSDSAYDVEIEGGQTVFLVIDIAGSQPSPSLEARSSDDPADDPEEAYAIPLYRFDAKCEVDVDFRGAPVMASMWEFNGQ